MLTATTGIHVQQIYCYCAGKTTLSLFAAEDACQAAPATETAASCKKETPSCCKASKKDKTSHDCTKKSTKVFQLKTEFLVDKPFEKTFSGLLYLPAEEPFFEEFQRVVFYSAEPSNKAPPPAPPPCSGRTICLRHQLFLC